MGLIALAFLSPWVCLAEGPPEERGDFGEPDLVELVKIDPLLRLDIRYATTNNFIGRAVYREPRAFLQRPAAEALRRVHKALREKGFGLVIYDAYRPWSVVKIFWDETPMRHKQFVADPGRGSGHSRGCAVDLTLCDAKTGKPAAMPGAYDEWSERSAIGYGGGTKESRRLRDLLRDEMESEGFFRCELEWWHYTWKDAGEYQNLDIPFSKL